MLASDGSFLYQTTRLILQLLSKLYSDQDRYTVARHCCVTVSVYCFSIACTGTIPSNNVFLSSSDTRTTCRCEFLVT